MNERRPTRIGDTLWRTIEYAIHIETSPISEANFAAANKHLEEGSIMLVANHFNWLDTSTLALSLKTNGIPLDTVTGIASRRHLANPVKNYIISKLKESQEFDVIEITQTKDFGRFEDHAAFNRNAILKGTRLLRRKGNVVAISAEGERSKTGGLLQARGGAETLFRLGGDNVRVLPVSMYPYNIRPFTTTTHVEAGSLLSFDKAEEKMELVNQRLEEFNQQGEIDIPLVRVPDIIMMHIALPMPPNNHGFYKRHMEIAKDLIAS